VLVVVRRRLPRKLRVLFDSWDFVQETFGSFFTHAMPGTVEQHPEKLKGYLAAIAQHKVADAKREYLDCQKRNLRNQRCLTARLAQKTRALFQREPTPEEAAIENEERSESDEFLRRILRML